MMSGTTKRPHRATAERGFALGVDSTAGWCAPLPPNPSPIRRKALAAFPRAARVPSSGGVGCRAEVAACRCGTAQPLPPAISHLTAMMTDKPGAICGARGGSGSAGVAIRRPLFHANVLTIAESGCSCETSSPRGLSRRNHTTFVSKIVVVRGDTMTDKHAISACRSDAFVDKLDAPVTLPRPP